MNDPESRINEALLPIGQNQQQQQRVVYSTSTTTSSVPASSSSSRVVYTHGSNTSNLETSRFGSEDEYKWVKCKKYCWWICAISVVVIIFMVISLKLFLFKPISKGPPKLDNSTATEPNTKTAFRLLLNGPRNRVQSLVGASAWTYKIPIPTKPQITIAAVGLYVERAEGKRRLQRFRNKEIDDELVEDITEVLSRGGMTETLRYVLSTTPPSGRLIEMYDDYTRPILEKNCPDLAEQEFNTFKEFFPEDPKSHDDFSFERREGLELWGYRKEDRKDAVRIGGVCMAKAIFQGQLEHQKGGLVNLLEDFYER